MQVEILSKEETITMDTNNALAASGGITGIITIDENDGSNDTIKLDEFRNFDLARRKQTFKITDGRGRTIIAKLPTPFERAHIQMMLDVSESANPFLVRQFYLVRSVRKIDDNDVVWPNKKQMGQAFLKKVMDMLDEEGMAAITAELGQMVMETYSTDMVGIAKN